MDATFWVVLIVVGITVFAVTAICFPPMTPSERRIRNRLRNLRRENRRIERGYAERKRHQQKLEKIRQKAFMKKWLSEINFRNGIQ